MIDRTACSASLHEDTLVHTARGLVPIKEVAPGETVFAFDEDTSAIRPTVVVRRVAVGPTQIFAVRVGTRTIRAAADARLLALVDRRRPGRQRRRFRREWIRMSELKVGDIVAVARKSPDLGRVQEIPLPSTRRDRRARAATLPVTASEDLMWWTGLYAGDGFVHHSGQTRRVEFAIPASQPDVQAELAIVTKRLFDIDTRIPDPWRVVVASIRVVDYIGAIGLGGTALEKRIPAWVFASPEPHRLAFLGGYVDADGDIRAPSAGAHNKDMGLTSGNPELLEDARRLAVMCGIRTSTIWRFRSRHPYDRTRWIIGYRMRFAGDFDRVICRSARRITRMHKRKYFHNDSSVGGTKLNSHMSEWIGFARIESISVAAVAGTFSLSTDGRHAAIAESLIVGI